MAGALSKCCSSHRESRSIYFFFGGSAVSHEKERKKSRRVSRWKSEKDATRRNRPPTLYRAILLAAFIRITSWLQSCNVLNSSVAGESASVSMQRMDATMSSSSQGDMYPHIALDQAKLKATFKTPSISNRSAFVASGGLDTSRGLSSSTSVLGPSKRRRLLPDGTYVYESHADGAPPGEGNSPAGTSRLGAVNARGAGSPAAAEASVPAKSSGKPQVYECTWRKPQYKKHKTWDGDAYLLVYPDKRLAVMKCIDTRAE